MPLELNVTGMVGEEDLVGAEEALPSALILGEAEVEWVAVGGTQLLAKAAPTH